MKQPDQILKDWMQAINTGDLEALMALYDEKAVLIPTFSNRLLQTPENIRDYFSKVCLREELSIALHEKTFAVQQIHGPIYGLSGIYCWRFAIDGEMLSFEARFSYVLDLDRAKPIVQHHSSQIPRML
ncbi:nuclear transport factor 2 family protein [Propionivibrio limicola]|uniref:nuclear transport factor 2 family protein n=1 Tax=Propionivibrio limicola TaxID=167645 RepID=UPI0012916796|nr:nuclear transport factor 2 family protein [Propionivibrio limicola]